MKKIIAAILCILILLTVSACGEKPETPTVSDPTPPVQNGQDISETTETDAPVSSEPQKEDNEKKDEASPLLQTAITDDEHFARFSKFYPFGDDPIEDYVMWCDAGMTDFYVLGIYYGDEGYITDGKHLFDVPSVKPDEAINYMRMVPEGMPTDAVVYTANGKTYTYAVTYNGRDGGIYLSEIENLTVDPDFKAPSFDEPESADEPSSEGFMAEIYWVNDDLEVFAREMTVESDSKWHVWKALKSLNSQIPSKCSLLSGTMVKGRNGIMELDFSKEFKDIGGMTGRPVLEAIANTYITAYDLQAVRFMVEGEYLESAICGYSEEFAYTNF